MAKQAGKNQFTGPAYEQAKIEALTLWLGGATYVKIGNIMDVDTTTARARVQRALDDMRPHADYARYQARQIAEMEQVRVRLMQSILTRDEDWLDSVGQMIKLWSEERKVLGMDKVEDPLAAEVARLAKMSREELAIEAFGRPAGELESGGTPQAAEGTGVPKPDSAEVLE